MKALLAVACSLSVAVFSHAQNSPSDIELRASYCIPVVQAAIRLNTDMLAQLAGSTNETDHLASASLEESRSKSDSDLRRLQAYALPKLAGHAADDYVLGFAAAAQRGKADLEGSMRAVNSCSKTCGAFGLQCVQSCVAREPANQRVAVCHSLDWLPF